MRESTQEGDVSLGLHGIGGWVHDEAPSQLTTACVSAFLMRQLLLTRLANWGVVWL